MKTFVKIKNGEVTTFDGDFSFLPLQQKKRVSWIEPVNPLWWIVFKFMRLFGFVEESRHLPVLWGLRFKKIGLFVKKSYDRKHLIELERKYITKKIKL